MVADLVTFENPPIRETVLSIGFERIPGFNAAHLGRFWSEIATEFPQSRELPRYEMPFELPAGGTHGRFTVDLNAPATLPRVLFLDQNETQLCQVQADWFAINWRQHADPTFADGYQRYSVSRDKFQRLLTQFSDFVNQALGHRLVFQQYEISYINHIVANEEWATFDQAHHIFRFLSDSSGVTSFPIEQIGFNTSHLISSDSEPIGRLHIAVQPGVFENRPMFALTLTARGRLASSSIESTLASLDSGREAIVTSFQDITTDRMHSKWGLT